MSSELNLKTLSRFVNCSNEDVAILSKSLLIKNFKKGDPIFSQGAIPQSLTVVKEGFVKVFKETQHQSNLMFVFGPGHAFGEIVLGMNRPFPVSAQCLTNCEILFFPKELYMQLKSHSPSFRESSMVQSGTMALCLCDKHLDLTDGEVEERTKTFMGSLFLNYGTKITNEQSVVPFVLSRSEIASAIGARPETVSRVMSILKKSGDFQKTRTQMIARNSAFLV